MSKNNEAALREATVARELECAFMRKGATLFAAVALAILLGSVWSHPLHDAIALLYVIIVAGPVSYLFVARYTPRSIEAIIRDPAFFADARQRAHSLRPFPGSQEMLGFWVHRALVTTCVLPSFALFITGKRLLEVLSIGEVMLPVFACFAVVLWWDTVIWPRRGRQQLLNEAAIDSYELMVSRGYRWVWWAGWVRSVRDDHTAAAPPHVHPASGPAPGEKHRPAVGASVEQTEHLRQAVVTEEQQLSRKRRWSWAGVIPAALLGLSLPVAPLAYLAGMAYAAAVVAPALAILLPMLNVIAVDRLIESPRMCCVTHSGRRTGPQRGALDNLAQLVLGYAWFFLTGLGFGVVIAIVGEVNGFKDLAPVLFVLFLCIALPGLIAPEVWARQGRIRLQRETGLDAYQIMVDSGYTWTWYWGWLRDNMRDSEAVNTTTRDE